MSDYSAIPVRRGDDARQMKDLIKEKPRSEAADSPAVPAMIPTGPRKLIRPRLPEGVVLPRRGARVSTMTNLHATSGRWNTAGTSGETTHAEAFFFQKQIQSQTLMIFVLEDGQQIEGYIEWYDRHSIKVKNGGRTLIYKSSIKYLYKSADQNQA